MPTISTNIYFGLQKWVNRASISLRGRRGSRHNSVSSTMTMYQRRQQHENTTGESVIQDEIIPMHGRSRSNPVPMPESALTFDSNYQKIPKVPTHKPQPANERLRKQSSEFSDDSSRGSYKERSKSVVNRRLSIWLSCPITFVIVRWFQNCDT